MAHAGQKRKLADRLPKKAQRPRKSKRASSYHSSSSEDEAEPLRNDSTMASVNAELDTASIESEDGGVHIPNPETTVTSVVDENGVTPQSNNDHDNGEEMPPQDEVDISQMDDAEESEEEEDNLLDAESSIPDDESTSTATRERRLQKRNDPSVFASSILRILDSKLTTGQRTDPILSRSKSTSTNLQEQADARLTAKAKRKMKEEKRTTLEKGRQKDVLGLDRPDVSTGKVVEKEKDLRRTAQRGVVKLFNAVRAAQVKGMEAEKGERSRGTVGMDKRKERVEDMGKKAFLDLLVEGGA